MRAGIALALVAQLAWSEVVISGVVRDDGDEKGLSRVKIHLPSGKELGSTDREGRFEFVLPSDRMTLIFEKAGFEPRTVLLSELKDLLGTEIYMHSSLQRLDTTLILGTKSKSSVKLGSYQPLDLYERTSGMKLDLSEQIAQIPGVSAKKDFSGKLAYLGAKPGDLALNLGGMDLPWPQHLDFGFPGSLSGLSPKLVSRVKLDRGEVSASNPAGTLSMAPLVLPTREMQWDLSAGNALFESMIALPTGAGAGLAVDFRFLNPVVLKNMGQKYFTENRRQQEPCTGQDCSKYGNQYDLSAMDGFAYYRKTDSSGAFWSASALWLRDRYDIQQDTSRSYQGDGAQLQRIFAGGQDLYSLSMQWQNSEGVSNQLQWLSQDRSALQRDTLKSAAVSLQDSSLLNQQSIQQNQLKWTRAWELEGGALKFDAAWKPEKYIDSTPLKPWVLERDLYEANVRWNSRTRIQGGAREWSLGAMGRSDRALPGALLCNRYEWSDSVWARGLELGLSSKAWDLFEKQKARAQWQYDLLALGDLKLQSKDWSLGVQPFARLMQNPEMPTGEWMLWLESSPRDQAYAAGASVDFQAQWGQSLRLRSQWSHLSGEYLGGESLPWSENRLLEAQTQMRYFPMADTNFSVILSHRISMGQPLYQFKLNPLKTERKVEDAGLSADFYRTDVRFELDLPSKVFPLKRGRLYFEADNLFAALETDALRFLGAQNLRQRGWTVVDGVLKPSMARGQGLFLMFGIDASLGF